MKEDFGTYQGSRSAAVECHSVRVSLAFGVWNDVFGSVWQRRRARWLWTECSCGAPDRPGR